MQGCLCLLLTFLAAICSTAPKGETQYPSPSNAKYEPSQQEENSSFPSAFKNVNMDRYPITVHDHMHHHNYNHHMDPSLQGQMPVRNLFPYTTVKQTTIHSLSVKPTAGNPHLIEDSRNRKNYFNITRLSDILGTNDTKRFERYDPEMMVYPTEVSTPLDKPQLTSRNCTFGLCDQVENYPVDRIERIISRSKELKQYFEGQKVIIGNRFGEDGEPLCPTKTHTQFPQSAINIDNVERLLVNHGEYKQGLVYETCATGSGECQLAESFPNGYTTSCVQKYTVRRLMAVGKDSDKPIFDNFQLPSCCVCLVKRNS